MAAWYRLWRHCGGRNMVGMVGVVPRHHRSLASAGDQSPTVIGLEAVVVPAEPVEIIELGLVGVSPRCAVVDFGMGPRLVAALATAAGLTPEQRHVLRGARPAPEVNDGGDIPAPRD